MSSQSGGGGWNTILLCCSVLSPAFPLVTLGNVTLRKLASDQRSSWLVGVSTGSVVHTLDPRTGELFKVWKAAEPGGGTVGAVSGRRGCGFGGWEEGLWGG